MGFSIEDSIPLNGFDRANSMKKQLIEMISIGVKCLWAKFQKKSVRGI